MKKHDSISTFVATHSLYLRASLLAESNGTNLSRCYDGGVGFIGECVRIGNEFDAWACEHVDFDQMAETWPYLLEGQFGRIAIEVAGGEQGLVSLGTTQWPLIAAKLKCVLLID